MLSGFRSRNTDRVRTTTVLLDLDGVVRHFDLDRVRAIEQRCGLRDGILHEVAFESELIDQVITGRIRRSDWVQEVGERVGQVDAAVEAFADVGAVDGAILAEVDALRARGTTVAVLTNGTDTIPEEMKALEIESRFDTIFNSAELGVAKPDRRVFEMVCSRLGVDPAEVLFTDDSERKLEGAIEIGMTARHFTGVDAFIDDLREVGLRA